QILAVNIFHHQIRLRAVETVVQHADDMGMIELAGNLAFLSEAQALHRIGDNLGGNYFDGDDLLGPRMLTLVDGALPAFADLFQNEIFTNRGLSDPRRDDSHVDSIHLRTEHRLPPALGKFSALGDLPEV